VVVAAKVANLKHGGDRTNSPNRDLPGIGAPVAITQATAAELLNVGKRSIERAADHRRRRAERSIAMNALE
jgi:hypothetical protein